jgi:hypothetical protein
MRFTNEIDKVWVQFRGLPKEFQEFPIIWAIGSILDVPRAVDTKFTKKFGRARMKVVVLDPNLIPDLVDVMIGDYVYELQFRVEQDMSNVEPQVIDMDSTMDEGKPNGEKRAITWMRMGKKGRSQQIILHLVTSYLPPVSTKPTAVMSSKRKRVLVPGYSRIGRQVWTLHQ